MKVLVNKVVTWSSDLDPVRIIIISKSGIHDPILMVGNKLYRILLTNHGGMNKCRKCLFIGINKISGEYYCTADNYDPSHDTPYDTLCDILWWKFEPRHFAFVPFNRKESEISLFECKVYSKALRI